MVVFLGIIVIINLLVIDVLIFYLLSLKNKYEKVGVENVEDLLTGFDIFK